MTLPCQSQSAPSLQVQMAIIHVQSDAQKSGICMIYVERAVRQFWKRLALIIAVKRAYIVHYVQTFKRSL